MVKKHLVRVRLVLVGLIVAVSVAIAIEINTPPSSPPAVISPTKTTTKPFTFAAVGDFSSTPHTDLVLRKIAASDTDFTLALGDLGYGGNGTELTWCNYVHQRLNSDYPFELVAGNHDDGSKDGDIVQYSKCLTDKIGAITGDYGREYYFDYGGLARFILISPNVKSRGYDYVKGSVHYDWLAAVIDSARDGGMKWIVLGMHKNCITIGEKSCEIGEDLLNLAVEKKVDLILQGHEHGYMRSKQLGLSPACAAITARIVDVDCVTGHGGDLKKASGSTIVIAGTGGVELRDIHLNDSEIGYFETWNGSNVGKSHGFSKFSISDQEIRGDFESVNGEFIDSFTIR